MRRYGAVAALALALGLQEAAALHKASPVSDNLNPGMDYPMDADGVTTDGDEVDNLEWASPYSTLDLTNYVPAPPNPNITNTTGMLAGRWQGDLYIPPHVEVDNITMSRMDVYSEEAPLPFPTLPPWDPATDHGKVMMRAEKNYWDMLAHPRRWRAGSPRTSSCGLLVAMVAVVAVVRDAL
mmetsp:Transcript_69905/g.220676  ORF Transcript_69905/g.220676 Transcript_69905/m.220676 type:complete len:181 (-) Transcript_69905:44-586(-)